MRNKLRIFILVILGIFSTAAMANSNIDAVVAFGDSLTDNGNFYHLEQGKFPQPPYYFGRCTNGLTWVEILTSELTLAPNHLDDRAIAKAQSSGSNPAGMTTQVTTYIAQHPNLDPGALYVIWIGGNNYLFHPYESSKKVQKTIADINTGILALHAHGARYFVIPNLPDLSKIPFAAVLEQKYPRLNIKENLARLSSAHNQALAADLQNLQQKFGPDTTIVTVDVASLFAAVQANPSQYGLINATDACYVSKQLLAGGGQECAHPNQYLFWDAVHPTLTVHQVLAELVFQQLTAKGLVQTSR